MKNFAMFTVSGASFVGDGTFLCIIITERGTVQQKRRHELKCKKDKPKIRDHKFWQKRPEALDNQGKFPLGRSETKRL